MRRGANTLEVHFEIFLGFIPVIVVSLRKGPADLDLSALIRHDRVVGDQLEEVRWVPTGRLDSRTRVGLATNCLCR